jgi:endonuclease/exonuclease/phosphatase family metal-dependent hydrolase
MPFPARLSIISCNLWMTERWPARAPALERFLQIFAPDVLCVQELMPETQSFIDKVLESHERVHDPLAGWTVESNMWWNASLLERIEHGAEDVQLLEKERRLFWARLKLRGAERAMLVSTAHLTAPGKEPEASTGNSPRVGQLQRIGAALGRLVNDGEPAFFMGDMNDARHPQRILKESGYVTAFAALGLQSTPTFKCYPTADVAPGEPAITEAIDLIFANRHARAVAAHVPNFFFNGTALSDHWPVQAVYEIG